ncbi:MAG: hypothetical protein AAGA23_05535 [Pseudomonadota bacterium]
MKKKEAKPLENRRDFLKKAGYATPAILTLAAMPAMASTGSSGGGGTDPDPTDPT